MFYILVLGRNHPTHSPLPTSKRNRLVRLDESQGGVAAEKLQAASQVIPPAILLPTPITFDSPRLSSLPPNLPSLSLYLVLPKIGPSNAGSPSRSRLSGPHVKQIRWRLASFTSASWQVVSQTFLSQLS
jgi:hypothetical protein